MVINNYKRYQKDLKLHHLYPITKGVCACGCGVLLTGRQTKWASRECNERVYSEFAIIKGDNASIRHQVFSRDQGYCMACGVFDECWQADHIIPVFLGGGACSMENLQTLCSECHKIKTNDQMDAHRKQNY